MRISSISPVMISPILIRSTFWSCNFNSASNLLIRLLENCIIGFSLSNKAFLLNSEGLKFYFSNKLIEFKKCPKFGKKLKLHPKHTFTPEKTGFVF